LVDTLGLARRTQRVIKQNLAWAMLYNAVAIPAAVSGWVSPLSASIGMAASSAIVIANALRAARPALWLQAERRKSADVGPLAAEHALGSKGL
jgi:Cu2+-exporting ATPase